MWIEINLDNLAYNYRQIQKMAGEKKLMPVIKADAYGHDAVMTAEACLAQGAARFAVATAAEAISLRNAGITTPLLVFGAVPPACVDELAARGVALTVPGPEAAREYLAAAGRRPVKIHLKVDTGMNRLGFSSRGAPEALLAVAANPAFETEGIYTHFAASGDPARDPFTREQHGAFQQVIAALAARGCRPPVLHCMNSDAIVRFPEFGGNFVRPGILLYGYPSPSPNLLPLRPPASVRARIGQIKWIGEGETVGYNLGWTARRPTRVATVAAGYADGLLRTGSGKVEMLVRGKRVPQIGFICMDMCMLDVTDLPEACPGDIATIVGEEGGQAIRMDELAAACGTIPYEPLTLLSARSPRYFLKDGKVVSVKRRVSVSDPA